MGRTVPVIVPAVPNGVSGCGESRARPRNIRNQKHVQVREDIVWGGYLAADAQANAETTKDWADNDEFTLGDTIQYRVSKSEVRDPDSDQLAAELCQDDAMVLSDTQVWHASVSGALDVPFTNNTTSSVITDYYRDEEDPDHVFDVFSIHTQINVQIPPEVLQP